MEYRCSKISFGAFGTEGKLDSHMEKWVSDGWSLITVTQASGTYTFFWKK